MPDTELDRAIAAALQRLDSGAKTARGNNTLYIEAFKASARRKAEAVLALLKDDTFPAKQPVFVSVGGGDGEELAYLLEHSTARYGVLLEYSHGFAEFARKRSLADGKTIDVFEGSAQSQIAKAMKRAAELVRNGEGDALIVTCHAVIHELYDRGEEFDPVGFFGRIFQFEDLPTGFTYREPGDVADWPEQLVVSARCSPESLHRLAEAIRLRHPPLKILLPEPQVMAGESLRVHRTLGLELLAKLFYLDDLPHEIEERSTAVDHQLLVNAIHTAAGQRARIEDKLVIQTHAGPTGSFIERWKAAGIRVEGIASDHSTKPLALPEFQKRAIVWRDGLEESIAPVHSVSPGSSANYDPQFPPFNVPYSPKRDAVIGRAEGLQKVRNQLTQGRRTSIGQTASFNGLGGLGKTQLAVEYAWEYRNEYPNGVIWIEADQEIDAQLTALAVNARWAAEASEHRYKLDVARKRLQSFSNCLIIFDNVERRAAIERYLPEPGASPHLLITSREPQPGFEPVPLAPLDENQSVYMLIQEAGRDPKTAEETIAAQEIAKRLDGLPLAIEIAGAYLHEMPTVTFDEFRRLLSRDPQIQMARNLLSSFTRHEADLAATLRISDRAFKQEPLLESILDLLTWSGAGAMGHALMSYVLGVDQLDLVAPLAFGARLHLLKEELTSAGPCTDHRYRIHRLVRDVRRANTPITNRGDWVAGISARIGEWFEQRRQDFAHLAQYELEFDHLRTWQGNASNIGDASAARLLWLEAYPAWHRGNYRESLRLLESAVGRLNSLGGMPELYAHLLNDLGAVWHLLGDNKLSLEYHEKSLSKRRELSGDLHADTAMSYDNLGSALSRAGDYQRALEFAEKGLSIRRELLGEEHPDTAHSYSNVGQVYHRLGDHRRSLEYAEKSLSIERKIRGEKHPETAHGYSNAGTAYDALGDHRRALEYKKKSLSINIELLGNKHPVMASVYSAIAGTYSYLDDHSRSLDYAQKSLSLRREQLGEEHPDTATSYNHLGTVYGNLGDHRRALKLHQAGLKIAIAILGPTHPDTIKILIDAAITQEKDGHSSESFKLIQHAARSLPEGHPMLHRLRDVKRQLIKKHPLLRSLSSGHPPPKPRNRKKK